MAPAPTLLACFKTGDDNLRRLASPSPSQGINNHHSGLQAVQGGLLGWERASAAMAFHSRSVVFGQCVADNLDEIGSTAH